LPCPLGRHFGPQRPDPVSFTVIGWAP